ncbi:hypothetical protein MOE92_02195 [Bacillus spizizenii]|nr:hypothetical protein [Bacillus spizizenii]
MSGAYVCGESTILIDAGMPGHFKAIWQNMEANGRPLAVILTHQDVDQVSEMLSDAGHRLKFKLKTDISRRTEEAAVSLLNENKVYDTLENRQF